MQLSSYASYGIMAVREMAGRKRKPLTNAELAETLGVSMPHAQQITRRLLLAKIVSAIRGPNGGYVLADSPGKVRLIDVIEAMDGKPICQGGDDDPDGLRAIRAVVSEVVREALGPVTVTSLPVDS